MMKEILALLTGYQKGVEEALIREAEAQLEVRLPEEYIQLFGLANGPEVGEWKLFSIKDPENLKKTWDDLVRQNKEVAVGEIPEGFLAIAEDGTGDFLCLKVEEGEAKNPIFLWSHELDEIEELAPTLKDFILSEDGEEDFDEE